MIVNVSYSIEPKTLEMAWQFFLFLKNNKTVLI